MNVLAQNAIEATGGNAVDDLPRLLGHAIDQACEELKLVEHFLADVGVGDIDMMTVVAGIRKRLALASDSGEDLISIARGARAAEKSSACAARMGVE